MPTASDGSLRRGALWPPWPRGRGWQRYSRPISAGAVPPGYRLGRYIAALGSTICAAPLGADLRDFTALSEVTEPAVMITALDAWFDRITGAVHAFGGEVLKFIGDGVLAIFPVTAMPGEACEAALRRVGAAALAWPISMRCGKSGVCRRCPSAPHCILVKCCGEILERPTA